MPCKASVQKQTIPYGQGYDDLQIIEEPSKQQRNKKMMMRKKPFVCRLSHNYKLFTECSKMLEDWSHSAMQC